MSDCNPQSLVILDKPSQIDAETGSLFASKKKKLAFDDLPFEIRKYIFEFCGFREYLDWKPKGDRRPNPYQPLLVALRPQPFSYQQMLQLSYDLDTVYLERKNNWSLEGMPVTVMRMIKKLLIIVEEADSIDELDVIPDPACVAAAGEHATNIREVTLELHFRFGIPETDWVSELPKWISRFRTTRGRPETDWVSELPKWISRFNRLARFEFVLTGLSWDRYKEQKEVAEGIVGLVSTKVGVKVRSHRGVSVLNVGLGELEIQQKAWEWEAEKGKVIDCSKLASEE